MAQNILGYFCDQTTLYSALGVPVNATVNVSSLLTNVDAALNVEGRLRLFQELPAQRYPKFEFSPVQELFVRFDVLASGGVSWQGAHTDQGKSVAKCINFYNSDGAVLFSFGIKPADPSNPYSATFSSGGLGGIDNRNIVGMFFYNVTDSNTYTDTLLFPDIPLFNYNYGNIMQTHIPISIHIKLDAAVPANSKIAMYQGSCKLAETTLGQIAAAIGSLTANVAKVTINENYYEGVSITNNSFDMGNFVLCTEFDLSITACSVPLASFGSVNNFTGALSNITEVTQDTKYCSTTAELESVCQLKLLPLSSTTIESIDLFFFGRYVQSGGVSANFEISIRTSAGVDMVTPVIVTVQANRSDSKYQVSRVLRSQLNLVTSAKFTPAELANGYVQIKLVGV